MGQMGRGRRGEGQSQRPQMGRLGEEGSDAMGQDSPQARGWLPEELLY